MTETEAMRARQVLARHFGVSDEGIIEPIIRAMLAFATTNPLPLVGDREALIERLSAANAWLSMHYTDEAEEHGCAIDDAILALRPTDLQAENEQLREALAQWKCASCHGNRFIRAIANGGTRKSKCLVCDGTGMHPLARLALNPESSQ
jgi:hypothetical protein